TVNSTKQIQLINIGTGIYKGTYELNSSDAEYSRFLHFQANASYGLNSDSIKESIRLSEEPSTSKLCIDLDVDDPRDNTPRPGDTVEFTIKIEKDGILVDPDTLTITSPTGSLTYNRTAIGIYKTIFTVNPNMMVEDIIKIEAEASYNEQLSTSVINLFVDFINVWLFNETVDEETNTINFEIWVADLEGKPVVDASVNLMIGLGYYVQFGPTDQEGKALVSIYHGESNWPFIHLSGDVTTPSGIRQDISLSFLIGEFRMGPNPRSDEFDVFHVSGERRVELGETFDCEYVAYYDKILWKNDRIYYYVVFHNVTFLEEDLYQTSKEGYLVDKDYINTDNEGKFNITFKAPDYQGEITIFFEAGVKYSSSSNDNLSYDRTSYPYISVLEHENGPSIEERLNIDISDIILGGKTNVTATMDGSSGYIGKITWYLDDEKWSWRDGSFESYMTPGDNTHEGEIYIPAFLPLDKVCTIEVTLANPETGDIYYNYIKAMPSGKNPDMDDDELPDNWELFHFGDLSQGAVDDFDDDGYSNREEYQAETDPKDNSVYPDKGEPGAHWFLSNNRWIILPGIILIAVIAAVLLLLKEKKKKPVEVIPVTPIHPEELQWAEPHYQQYYDKNDPL
ncbi:MAG: hypothetical protein JSV09_02885, partial [Thermoplasmata archaeon]